MNKMKPMRIAIGLTIIFIGAIGIPSQYYEPPNTATMISLFGVLIFSLGF